MASLDGKIPVWLDCDPGHDDAFALLLLTHHPRFHLLGVSTTFGNAPIHHTTHNALALLTAFSAPHIPVYAGASAPLHRAPLSAPSIHGSSGLGGTSLLPAPACKAKAEDAIDAMASTIFAQKKGVAWIVTTGALTNLWGALERYRGRDLAGWVSGVSIMGGCVGAGFTDVVMGKWKNGDGVEVKRTGNWSPWAEFNVLIDPEAAQGVFVEKGLKGKMTMVGLDLTHMVIATEAVRKMLLWGQGGSDRGVPSTLRRLMVDLLRFYKSMYEKVFGFQDGPPLHDPVAVAVLLDGIVEEETTVSCTSEGKRTSSKKMYEVNVVVEGTHADAKKGLAQTGRTVVRCLPVKELGVSIPKTCDVDRFWEVMDQCLARAEQASSGCW